MGATCSQSFFEEMRNAGRLRHIESALPLFTSRVNYRNHVERLSLLTDVGFVGGMNLAERYAAFHGEFGVIRISCLKVKQCMVCRLLSYLTGTS